MKAAGRLQTHTWGKGGRGGHHRTSKAQGGVWARLWEITGKSSRVNGAAVNSTHTGPGKTHMQKESEKT